LTTARACTLICSRDEGTEQQSGEALGNGEAPPANYLHSVRDLLDVDDVTDASVANAVSLVVADRERR
jgi:hypothetical protein